ncbi:MAG TPA: TrkA family potassium uptake protein [Kiritimatiellia bacterium]|nr:TrkA family potassium uptake protein [Kiritimatiellia bacterium]HPS06653.1 TrkA family potassium uptake protein [Kiritimatiellia bacterium]
MKRIGIIGAGRFGASLAESLAEHGAEVLLIDQNRDIIQEFSEFVTKAVEGDASNSRTLEDAGFQECDVVVVAIGTNLEGSIMATVNCKELGVPTVVAKANSDLHGKILKRVGADMVVYPNRDCAKRIARTLLSKGSVDLFEISDGLSVAEIDVPESLAHKSLAEAEVRKNFGVTVLCVRRLADDPTQPRTVILPTASEIIQPDDKLLVFGRDKQIDTIAQDT